MNAAKIMESSINNETNDIVKRFSGISLSKVDIFDETENDTAHTKLQIKKLVEQMKSKIIDIKISAVAEIRKLLSEKDPPIDDVYESAVVPLLIDCLKSTELCRFHTLQSMFFA